MKRVLLTTAVATLTVVAAAHAAPPLTKQVGKDAVDPFTSICSVSGYVDYGLCGGNAGTFAGVDGKINVMQKSAGVYDLDFTFSGLSPGVEYRLWGTYNAVPFGGQWFEVGRAFADLNGRVKLSSQTSNPGGLGFDLNQVSGDITILTSWWSGDKFVVNDDTTLGTA
jgi:hypothetical protein